MMLLLMRASRQQLRWFAIFIPDTGDGIMIAYYQQVPSPGLTDIAMSDP